MKIASREMNDGRELKFAQDSSQEASVDPVYFDDSVVSDESVADRNTVLRFVWDALKDGPDETAAARIDALGRVAGYDRRPLREAVDGRTFSKSTHERAVRSIRKQILGTSFTSEKP